MRPMLLFFSADGCPACEIAKPEFEKYLSRNPLQMALRLDADGPYARHFVGKTIKVTPLYLLVNDGRVVGHEGAMKAERIEKWIKAAKGVTDFGLPEED
ncbi:MAG TPA: thioredoxin family protein [Nitrososphaerales archaeon]|nr:thioredoxin family protein [Nitrososphaerales archaeon]